MKMPLLKVGANGGFVANAKSDFALSAVAGNPDFVSVRRPYLAPIGFGGKEVACVTVTTGRYTVNKGVRVPLKKRVPVVDLLNQGMVTPELVVANAATLRKDDWVHLDTKVAEAYRKRIRAWADLLAVSTIGGFDGWGRSTYEYEAMSDGGEVMVDMDGVAGGRGTSPLFSLRSIPLPITHADFEMSARRIDISRNSSTPLDTTMAEQKAKRIAETLEKTLIGVQEGLSYGYRSSIHDSTFGSQVYGYTNFPARITINDLTAPTGSNPEAVLNDVLRMRQAANDANVFGDFMLYHSPNWDKFMDNDYARLGGNNANQTLRDRIRAIENIQDVRRLDFLTTASPTDYVLILVQMASETASIINGMSLTTLQWDTLGGMQKNFKLLCVQVPLLKADYNNVTGIVHARTA